MKNYIKYSVVLALGLLACEPELENPIDEDDFYTSGTADLSNFVALGNSLTAGYADGALYITGQQNSFPNILAGQFALAGGGEFTQPLMADNLGGFSGLATFPNRLVLSPGGDGLSPTRLGGTPATDFTNVLSGSFNNMGVPGAKSFHLGLAGYGSAAGVSAGTANPYFVRFASSPDATVIADAVAQNPSFFTLWIGNNDILSFATSGGVGIDQTGNLDPATYGSSDITDPNVFASVYNTYVSVLTGLTPDGILVNIPDVTSIPYFTTVPFAPLNPASPDFGAQIPTLNATFAPINQAFAFLGVPERSIQFSANAASAVVIMDESMPNISQQLTQVLIGGGLDAGTATVLGQQFGQARQANENDLLVLPSSSIIGEPNAEYMQQLIAMGVPEQFAAQLSVNGITYPLQDQYTLTASEQEMVSTAQRAYNQTIAALAAANDLILIDAEAILNQLADGGISYDSGMLTSTFATGGAFSLDGVHPTPRGYAYLANEMIAAINKKYEANIPRVNLGDYNTISVSASAD
ncbi:SGNH/GDSL hydrolase family protein [Flavimarina sp. Hel_I_48]|uniref:SGNH/GDSL hydrolase family protein n=1 Tax=Flavimarina sp. Hel_I_48 TaxID=1392488 RepID=UPI0004DF4471|nr:SGNH/GDSL hydrolase family protein [Flavimarina sp. Hel_I_48]